MIPGRRRAADAVDGEDDGEDLDEEEEDEDQADADGQWDDGGEEEDVEMPEDAKTFAMQREFRDFKVRRNSLPFRFATGGRKCLFRRHCTSCRAA